MTNFMLLEARKREKIMLHVPCALYLFPERLTLAIVRGKILWWALISTVANHVLSEC